MSSAQAEEARRDALVERLFGATIGAFDLCGVYIGDRLGLYRALAERGPMSPPNLRARPDIHERYALEWLEQQAASAILDVVDADDGVQRFALPLGHAEALLDEESLNYVSPFGRLLVACLRPIDSVLDAYRNGGGVPYADYGADLHEGQAAFTRPLFSRLLAQEWLPPCPRSTRGSWPTRPPVWPTSPAEAGSRASRSLGGTRRSSSMASTSTPRRSIWPAATSPEAASRTG